MVFGCKAVWLSFFVWTGANDPSEKSLEGLECLAWMAGAWASQSDRGVSEEWWTEPAGGLMLGLHRDVSPSGKAFFEYLRIEKAGEAIFYYASPAGREATAFRLTECRQGFAVFENPEHDFPRKITYRLDPGQELCATVEGISKGKPRQSTWCWKAVKL